MGRAATVGLVFLTLILILILIGGIYIIIGPWQLDIAAPARPWKSRVCRPSD